MTISDIRRATARILAMNVGGPAEFARKVDMSISHISQLLGENPTKNIGPKIARRIEATFEQPLGWLDVAHSAEELDGLGADHLQGAPKQLPSPVENTGFTPFFIDPAEIELINNYRRGTLVFASDPLEIEILNNYRIGSLMKKLSIRAAANASDRT